MAIKNSKMGAYIDPKTDKEVSFNFWTDLGAKDKMRFVANVTDTIIGENYFSFLKNLIFDFEIIEMFTDIDTSDVSEATDTISMIEEFVNTTKVVEIVKSNVKQGLIDELMQAVEDNLEYRTGVHHNPLTNSVVGLINTIETKINEIDTNSMAQLAEMFNGMTGEITADGIINAYANSPIFLQSLEDRQKAHDKRFEKIVNSVSAKK